jgi:hypothetical protein
MRLRLRQILQMKMLHERMLRLLLLRLLQLQLWTHQSSRLQTMSLRQRLTQMNRM